MERRAHDANTQFETVHHTPGETHHEGFPFLALPPELRLVVYDAILSDLVGDLLGPSYKLPAELPCNDITDFIRLSLVCRIIRHELRHHFEQKYLNKVMLYFHDPHEVYRVRKLCSLLAPAYGSLRFTFIRHSRAAISSLQVETNSTGYALFDDNGALFRSLCARYSTPPLCQWSVLMHNYKREFDAFGLGQVKCLDCPRVRLKTCTRDGLGPRIILGQRTCREPGAERAVVFQDWRIDGLIRDSLYHAIAGKVEDLDGLDFDCHETPVEKTAADKRHDRRAVRDRMRKQLQSQAFLTRPAMANLIENLNCECCLRCRYADGGRGHVCHERMRGPHQDCECGRHEPRCSHV
ncbi:hypothetical protein Tdes44962_MAKER03261 [Teratosphaeria destructans]|uniref:F-box domain-containing protein n=1 Tax=Teratosphaeria destructans TaxID=418781 RepID=A0A9W7SQP9_9PEZI|nr:hypothetical protein Tdes44962_MAKER03261 [Teratosphaeria destructans]